MAGLLDFLQSPDAQLGIGLLAAGGPTTDPNQTGFGQRLNGAMQGMTRDQMAKAQLQEMQTKAALDQYSLQRMKDWQSMLMGGMGSSAAPTGASPAQTAQASGVTPPAAGAPMGGQSAPVDGGSAPVQAPQQRAGFPFALPGVGDMQSRMIAMNMNPADYMKMYADKAGPQTDIAKLMAAQGIDASSPQGQAMLAQATTKANYIAPANVRPGGYTQDAYGNVKQFPHVPEGSTAFQGPDGQFHIVPIDGGLGAISAAESAKKAGVNSQTPSVGYAGNTPVYRTVAQDVGAANGAPSNNPGNLRPQGSSTGFQAFATPEAGLAALDNNLKAYGDKGINTISGVVSRWAPPTENNTQAYIADVSKRLGVSPDQPIDLKNPIVRQALSTAITIHENGSRILTGGGSQPAPSGPPVTPVLAPGAAQGATLSQDELSKKGTELSTGNASANTVISRLQNIKMLAPGAITGAETSRRDFFNGLLSIAGVKGADDAKTASDLVDKNSAQIVTALRMGQGGAGTDALQTLLGAANPNRHMTVEAINDAADQLIASQKMAQAKAKILTPHVLGRDPQAYGAKELQFDQAADPRVFQLSAMNDKQQSDYVKKLPPQDAKDLLDKFRQLKGMGAL